MKIKLTESQLINTVKKQYNLTEESDQLFNFLKMWADLRKDSDSAADAIGKAIFDKLVMNPNFDTENVDLEDLETIDIWPINNTKITSPFGPRWGRKHRGVDLNASVGTPIYSPANGKVTAARDTTPNNCGGFVSIDHGKYQTKYCHLSKFDVVKKGDEVVKGQLIGYTGGAKGADYAGNSMGPHLHYEVLVNGRHVDPQRVHSELS